MTERWRGCPPRSIASMPTLVELRDAYHRDMCDRLLLGQRKGKAGGPASKTVDGLAYPVRTNADAANDVSVVLAAGIARRLNVPSTLISTQGSTLGALFEGVTREFLEESLRLLSHLYTRRLTMTGEHRSSRFARVRTPRGDPEAYPG